VIILTSTPNERARSIVSLVSGRGGSKNVRMPSMCQGLSPSFLATARERIPRSPRRVTSDSTRCREDKGGHRIVRHGRMHTR
jgi:hypothetical protein